MRKCDAEIVFTAALYGALFPAVMTDCLESEDDDGATHKKLHSAMLTANREAMYVQSMYMRGLRRPFNWYRRGK